MEIFQDKFFGEIKERLAGLGVKAILFDFDDTLIYTAEIFLQKMDEFVETVSTETGLDSELIAESLIRHNDESYRTLGVNPSKWTTVVDKVANEFGEHSVIIRKNLNILEKIYTREPRIRPGAKAILGSLNRTGVKLGLVTHANVDWTWMKLQYSGMMDFFETVVVADENASKGVECWQKAMNDLGVLPEECLVVGDSLNGDIIPTAGIGARTMWLHNSSSWSVTRTGKVPESTINLNNINELLSAVEGLR